MSPKIILLTLQLITFYISTVSRLRLNPLQVVQFSSLLRWYKKQWCQIQLNKKKTKKKKRKFNLKKESLLICPYISQYLFHSRLHISLRDKHTEQRPALCTSLCIQGELSMPRAAENEIRYSAQALMCVGWAAFYNRTKIKKAFFKNFSASQHIFS
jgi:hypothetical protein